MWARAPALVQQRHEPRGDSRPRLSGGAKLRVVFALRDFSKSKLVELRSTGQPRAAVPAWFVVIPKQYDCLGRERCRTSGALASTLSNVPYASG
jgi:hypothetical protein